MRITRNQLRQLIQEELGRTLRESPSAMGRRRMSVAGLEPELVIAWEELKGTPEGLATLDPSLRSQFKIKDWSDYERAARDADETIKGED